MYGTVSQILIYSVIQAKKSKLFWFGKISEREFAYLVAYGTLRNVTYYKPDFWQMCLMRHFFRIVPYLYCNLIPYRIKASNVGPDPPDPDS
jgi:hypothetical protein